MSAAKRRFFSGNTVEQALVQAAGHFQIEPERLAYRQIEKKHGFVRTRRRVVIEVDPDNPTEMPESRLAAGGKMGGDAGSGDRPSPRTEPTPAPPIAQQEQAARQEPVAHPRPSEPPKELQEKVAEEIPQAHTEAAPEGTESGTHEAESASEEAAPAKEKEEEAGGSAWWRAVHRDENDDETDSDDDDDDDDLDDDDDEEDEDDEDEDGEDEDGEDEDGEDEDDEDDEDDEEIDDDEVIAGAEDAMERILRLAGLDLDCTVTLEDETIYADLTGPDRGVLLDEDADLLQSIEMLLPRVMRGLVGDSYPCRVDSEGFRRKREKELQDLARKAAEVVREGVQAVTLEPMNPAERRIVHLALADAKDVKTESEGDGYFKQVVILRS